MEYGIQTLTTDTGMIQVDSNYKNILYNRVVTPSYSSIDGWTVDLTNNEFIFWLPAYSSDGLGGLVGSSTFIVGSQENEYLRGIGYGLEVYTPNNKLAFTSNSRPMIVRGRYDLLSIDEGVTAGPTYFNIPALRAGKQRCISVSVSAKTFNHISFDPEEFYVTNLWGGSGFFTSADTSGNASCTAIIVDF